MSVDAARRSATSCPPLVIDVTATVIVAGRARDHGLHAGAPRPRLREGAGRARHLHEHPLRHRLLQPLPHRLGRARTRWSAARDPPRRAGAPRAHADVHRAGHRVREDGDEIVVEVAFSAWTTRRARRRDRQARPAAGATVVEQALAGRGARSPGIGADRVLEGVGPHRAAARVRGGARGARRRRARAVGRRRARHLHARHDEEMEVARNLGIGDLSMFARIPYGGGAAAATVLQAAMAVATGRRRGRRLLPGVQRALGHAVRQHRRPGSAASSRSACRGTARSG